MQSYLKQDKIFRKLNRRVYEEIVAISILEEENIYNVLNNLLGEGIRYYKKRNVVKHNEL